MSPKPANLLNDLSSTGSDSCDFLVRALRTRQHRRTQYRTAGVCVLTVTALAMLAARLMPGHPPLAVNAPQESSKLTENELLDSFPGQPVALVTWPDGRKQLLAIAHPAPVQK
jgi:hypothetical protein